MKMTEVAPTTTTERVVVIETNNVIKNGSEDMEEETEEVQEEEVQLQQEPTSEEIDSGGEERADKSSSSDSDTNDCNEIDMAEDSLSNSSNDLEPTVEEEVEMTPTSVETEKPETGEKLEEANSEEISTPEKETRPTSSSAKTDSTTKETSPAPAPAQTDTRRRVKLYMLNQARTWDDRGTGHVTSPYSNEKGATCLKVTSEADGQTLLESVIHTDTAYQKQQDTLIVWSESNNYELALSFQERAGCDEIWAKICQVQNRDPSNDFTQEPNEDDENELPPCEVDRLDEINSVIASSLNMPAKKETITSAVETEHYIQKLLTIFRQLEEKKDIRNLQKLYEIFKNIFLLNRNSLFDILLSDEHLWDVIGVFEYDPTGAAVRESTMQAALSSAAGEPDALVPARPQTPLLMPVINRGANTNSFFTSLPSSSESNLMRLIREKRHREFLRNMARFKEVIPLGKSELVSKIHQTYRVQYIQDVIVPTPSLFEDNMLSTLSSFIFLNKVEIVTLIRDDDKFLKELFRQLADESPSFAEKRRDLVLFLKELCTFSHTLQLPNRELFIKTLNSFGILSTLEMLLGADDAAIKLGAVDIIIYLVDFSPAMIREFALQQELNTTKKPDRYLMNILIEQMVCDTDPEMGMATQISGILKMLIDPDNMLTTSGISQKTEKSEFLNYFYKHCIQYLTMPILLVTGDLPGQTKAQAAAAPATTTPAPAAPITTPEATTAAATPFKPPAERTNERMQNISCPTAQLLAILLELLTFCIEHHAYHIRSYLLPKHVIKSILALTKSRHTFLVLTVVRFMRRLVGLKDEFYNRHLMANNHLAPIVDIFLANRGRYNLLDSAVIDIFEFIHINQVTTLSTYTVEAFWRNRLERIDYVKTFRLMKNYYDQQHQIRERLDTTSIIFGNRTRYRRDPRQMDKDEDLWFNAEDDSEEDECADDDDEEECENYHDDDDDSPPSRQTDSAGAEVIPTGYHQFVPSNSPSSMMSSKPSIFSGGGHMSAYQPMMAGAGAGQQNSISSTTTSAASTSGVTSNHAFQSTSSSGYDNNPFSVGSPFFSSANAALKKKKNEKKTLTINLNIKTTSAINSGAFAGAGTADQASSGAPTILGAFGQQQLMQQQQQQQQQAASGSHLSQQMSNHSSFVKSFAPIITPTDVMASVPKAKGLVDYPDEDSDEEEDVDVPEGEEDDEDDEDELEEDEVEDLLKCESAFASTSGGKDTSLSHLRAKSVQLISASSSKQQTPSTSRPKEVDSSNTLVSPAESSSEDDSNSSTDSGDNLQSRTLSSCQQRPAEVDDPATSTASLVISNTTDQECVTSSRSEVSTSSSSSSTQMAVCGGGSSTQAIITSSEGCPQITKRRLSDDDDDPRITHSDEVVVVAAIGGVGVFDDSEDSNGSTSSSSSSDQLSAGVKRRRCEAQQADNPSDEPSQRSQPPIGEQVERVVREDEEEAEECSSSSENLLAEPEEMDEEEEEEEEPETSNL